MSNYTIGETAERSGFSASALRYYEGIGLVDPPTRTGAGYRLYDDTSLARLSFIARAKQLGCTLDEITDLVGIWDGEPCGPVQRRFHDLVTNKLAETERRIVELTALADQLHHAAGQLAGPATDGPCDETCACLAAEGATTSIPIYDATAPIACSAGDEYPVRIEQIARLREFGPTIDRTDHGLLLHFPNRPDVEADVRAFTVAEQGCCAFWGFDVTATDDSVTLRWDGPPAVADALDQVANFFESDAPLTALDGLL